MPRRDIDFVQGSHYHIFNRGAGKSSIFHSDEDYVRVLHLMKKVSKLCQFAIIAYCLLPNHYHWLVRQDGPAPANLLPKRVFGSYVRTFNTRSGRGGTLFEGRFDCRLVDTDEYLRNLCLYIHANPVRHGIAATPDLWPYSNYLEWIGLRAGALVDPSVIYAQFGDRQQYHRRMLDYLTGRSPLPTALLRELEALERQ